MQHSRTGQFDALVAPHLEKLHRVAYRLTRNIHDAQDLVQDTCVAACEHPADLKDATHPVRWLLRVLHNRFIDGTRRSKRAPFQVVEDRDEITRIPGNAPGPEELLQQSDDERALLQAFLQLEPLQRTLLTLRTEGHNLAEIEAITGIAREVLRARLHRARRTLAQHLTRQTGAAPLAGRARSNA